MDILYFGGSINEKVYEIGKFLLILGILQVLLIPIMWMILSLAALKYGAYTHISMSMMFPSVFTSFGITFFLSILGIIKMRELTNVINEDVYYSGITIALIGAALSALFGLILQLMVLVLINNISSVFLGGTLLLIILASGLGLLIYFIGRLLMALGLWHFGDFNKSDIIQLGCLIFVFLDWLGFIFIGYGFYDLAVKTREAMRNTAILTVIKDRLIREGPVFKTINLRKIAREYNIATYALVSLVNSWIAANEIKGFVSGYNYIHQE